MMSTQSPSPGGRQDGFAIVAVLMLVALMTTLSMTYIRHVMLDSTSSPASRSSYDAREAVQSGVHVAQQVLSTNADIAATSVATGADTAALAIEDLGDQKRRGISIQATDDYGLGSTILAEVERIPVSAGSQPDDLPRISSTMISQLLSDPTVPKTWLSGTQWIEDTDLEGLVIIENSASIFFDNVTLKGTLVSERALSTDPFGEFGDQTPVAIADGSLRIDSGDFLPGVAVVMPDGVLRTWEGDEAVLINGDVVANTVQLNGVGAVNGNIASSAPPTIGDSVELPGQGRGPRDWADGLDLGKTWTTSFMAFLPRYTTVAECQAIVDYVFPNEVIGPGGGGGGGPK
jgi:hypothetical protein